MMTMVIYVQGALIYPYALYAWIVRLVHYLVGLW